MRTGSRHIRGASIGWWIGVLAALFFCFGGAGASVAASSTAAYEAVDLGDFGVICRFDLVNLHISGANDVNNVGHATGWSNYADCDLSIWGGATLFHSPTLSRLPKISTPGTDPWNMEGVAVNDRDEIAGWTSLSAYAGSHAFLYRDGVTTDLGTLCSTGCDRIETGSDARGINSSTQVVGASHTQQGPVGSNQHAFLWEAGAMQDLGTLGGAESAANGINEHGQVVGSATTVAGTTHAFLWQSGSMNDLGTLGGPNSVATAINDFAEVVGYSETSSGAVHAFLRDGGGLRDLGTLGGSWSKAYAINRFGQVLGVSALPGDAEQHVFTYADGVMQDVTTLLPAGADFYQSGRSFARGPGLGINDAGSLVGQGTCRVDPCAGNPHAFMLRDSTAPSCDVSAGHDARGVTLSFTIRDLGSGLASIVVTGLSNANVQVPRFKPGTPRETVVVAEPRNRQQAPSVSLRVTDIAGNEVGCAYPS